jgi:hypothetical protein
LEQRWDGCAAFVVLKVEAEGNLCKIIRQTTSVMGNGGRYTIDVGKKTCERGQWQENGYPCIDAMAFFRLQQKKSFNYVLTEVVDRLYTYANTGQLLRQNIVPVCIETLSPDRSTMPPVHQTKVGRGDQGPKESGSDNVPQRVMRDRLSCAAAVKRKGTMSEPAIQGHTLTQASTTVTYSI